MVTFVVSKDRKPLMPTFNIRKVRKLLKCGKAVIFKHEPFTVQLTYETGSGTQDIEFREDTGYGTAGVSVASAKHEYASEEREFLADEKQKHASQLKIRRTRRNRKRYRAPRFNNRKRDKGWLPPSLKNKADRHVDIFKMYASVCPITHAVFETAEFDTHVLAAVEQGLPVPEGTDYQHGPRYGHDTLRAAVFARDGHTCLMCGKGLDEKRILAVHHINYLKGDRSDRMGNLATVCTKCHTSANHKPGGKLYEWYPKVSSMAPAAFMNAVKYYIIAKAKEAVPGAEVHMTFGTVTKRERLSRRLPKSHANDAYCIGAMRPKHRTGTAYYKKLRRNNRCLEKFYDASYMDIRDGKKKTGSALGCGRTKRCEPRNSDKNLRPFRGEKKSPGRRSIRKQRYPIRPGDIVLVNGKRRIVNGTNNEGQNVCVEGSRLLRQDEYTQAVDRKKQPIPVMPGKNVIYNGKPRKILSADSKTGDVMIRWIDAPAAAKVQLVKHSGGWCRTA